MIRAWFFNFDADAELADPSARTPSRAAAARALMLIEKVRALLGPGDLVVSGIHRLKPLSPQTHSAAPGAPPRAPSLPSRAPARNLRPRRRWRRCAA